MKEIIFITILIFIAFMLGWIINEVQNIKRDHETLPGMIQQSIKTSMKEEFQFQRDNFKLVTE